LTGKAPYRFESTSLQQRVNIEELLAEREFDIPYETVRCWVLTFGPVIARRLRRCRPRPSNGWHLDEMVVRIAGERMFLWRAVDHEGEVLDMVIQRRRDNTGWVGSATLRTKPSPCGAWCLWRQGYPTWGWGGYGNGLQGPLEVGVTVGVGASRSYSCAVRAGLPLRPIRSRLLSPILRIEQLAREDAVSAEVLCPPRATYGLPRRL